MGASSKFLKTYRAFMLVVVCVAIGAVGSLVVFILAALALAGPRGDAWVRCFFGGSGFWYFLSTVLLAVVAFPLVKRAHLKMV